MHVEFHDVNSFALMDLAQAARGNSVVTRGLLIPLLRKYSRAESSGASSAVRNASSEIVPGELMCSIIDSEFGFILFRGSRFAELISEASAGDGKNVFQWMTKETHRFGAENAPLEQVTFELTEVNSPEALRAVCDVVRDLNGVRDVQFVGGGAVVTFNPLGIRKEQICSAIRRSGYRATEIPMKAES